MPTTCSLYPLGELWSNPDAAKPSFYSVDDAKCEGLTLARNATQTVGQYRRNNALVYRRVQWDWFREV